MLIVTATLAIITTACEQNLMLDEYRDAEIEKILVVNSILNPDSVIGVSVTHPYFFSDAHTSFNPVTGLDIKVAGSDGEWETLMYNKSNKLYVSNRKPNAGEVLRLKVDDGLRMAISCDTVPRKVEIESVTVTGEGPIHIFWNRDYRFSYRITFKDTPGEENFYFLSVGEYLIPGEFTIMGQMDYTTDYVFQVLADMVNRNVRGWRPDGVLGYPFCDKGIDGQRYTITVNEVQQMPPVGIIRTLPREIKLYAISKPYFEYMVSVLSMDYDESALTGNLLSLGLIEPDKIYSNIEGGAGLMGSYNLSVARVDLLELTGGWPTKQAE